MAASAGAEITAIFDGGSRPLAGALQVFRFGGKPMILLEPGMG